MLVEPVYSKTVLTSCTSLLELCPLVAWSAFERAFAERYSQLRGDVK
jgi:hypothetical protein